MTVPLTVASSALTTLEQGDLSRDAGASFDRVVRGAQAIFECAAEQLRDVANVRFGWPMTRNDSFCDASVINSASDPCCNATLRSSRCCATRSYSYSAANVVSVDAKAASTQCRAPALGGTLLGSFARLFNMSLNGECEAQLDNAITSVDEPLGVVRLCFERAYRIDFACRLNSDCLSDLCLWGRCVPDPTRAASLILRCALSNLQDNARSLLALELGISVSSLEADLESAYLARVSTSICEELPLSGLPFVDSRTTPNVPGVTQSDCESVTPVRCEDGGDLASCSSREVCVYEWGGKSKSYSIALELNASQCMPGLCSTPEVFGARCGVEPGCDVAGELTEMDCRLAGWCSDVRWVPVQGVCVLPFSDGEIGRDECRRSTYRTPMGCVPFDRLVNCTAAGGRLVTAASFKAACEAGQRCTNGLTVNSMFVWRRGVWSQGVVQSPLIWRKAKSLALRRWIARVDWTKTLQLWSSVFTKQAALNLGSLLRCRLVPALAILQYSLCDCSVLLGRPASNLCWPDQNSALVLAVRRVAKGTSGIVRTAAFGTVNWFLSSCSLDTDVCILEVGLLLRLPVRIAVGTGGSIASSSGSGINGTDEMVYDDQNRYVGVALTQIMYLGMSSTMRGGVDICLLPKEVLLPQANCSNTTKCVPAFGFASTSSSRFVVASRVQVTLIEGRGFCGTVNVPGFYVGARVNSTGIGVLLKANVYLLFVLMIVWIV